MTIAKSYTFTNNTIIDPAEVNQNFDDVIAAVKASHHRDVDGTAIGPEDIASGWGLVPSGAIMLWKDLISNIPSTYVFCNGANGTPDMRNLFALCPGQDSGGTYDTGDTGGEANHILTIDEMPSHDHSVGLATNGDQDGSGSNGSIYGSGMRTGYTGGGQAHNNMPPFKALVYMMKT